MLLVQPLHHSFFFFFNDTATTEIYTLSLHDALPISLSRPRMPAPRCTRQACMPGPLSRRCPARPQASARPRSEEHTSELQSQSNLVCRLLLEKKNKINTQSRMLQTYHLQSDQRQSIT